MIENYECFLTDALHAAAGDNVGVLLNLLGDKTIDLGRVLRGETMDEARRSVAEQLVERLSFTGFDELSQGIETALGIPVSSDAAGARRAAAAVQLRNISVHNRGRVNHRCKDACGDRFPYEVGDQVEYQFLVQRAGANLNASVRRVDARLRTKFKLKPVTSGSRDQ